MTALAILNPDDNPDRLETMTQAELLEVFNDCFGITVKALLAAAAVLKIWQKNSWDLAELEGVGAKWLHRLRLIGRGQLLPELAVRFDASSFLDRFAKLPVDDQQKIVDDAKLPLLSHDKSVLSVQPSVLIQRDYKDQFKQVFAVDHIRSLPEQALYMDGEQKKKLRRQRKEPKVGKCNLDYERDGACHRGEFIPRADLEMIVKLLREGREGRG